MRPTRRRATSAPPCAASSARASAPAAACAPGGRSRRARPEGDGGPVRRLPCRSTICGGGDVHNRMRAVWCSVLATLVGAAVVAPAAAALDEVNTKRLRDAVTINGILRHERALQVIANASGGTRVSGSLGFEA